MSDESASDESIAHEANNRKRKASIQPDGEEEDKHSGMQESASKLSCPTIIRVMPEDFSSDTSNSTFLVVPLVNSENSDLSNVSNKLNEYVTLTEVKCENDSDITSTSDVDVCINEHLSHINIENYNMESDMLVGDSDVDLRKDPVCVTSMTSEISDFPVSSENVHTHVVLDCLSQIKSEPCDIFVSSSSDVCCNSSNEAAVMNEIKSEKDEYHDINSSGVCENSLSKESIFITKIKTENDDSYTNNDDSSVLKSAVVSEMQTENASENLEIKSESCESSDDDLYYSSSEETMSASEIKSEDDLHDFLSSSCDDDTSEEEPFVPEVKSDRNILLTSTFSNSSNSTILQNSKVLPLKNNNYSVTSSLIKSEILDDSEITVTSTANNNVSNEEPMSVSEIKSENDELSSTVKGVQEDIDIDLKECLDALLDDSCENSAHTEEEKDYLFVFSLLPILQRLSPDQKLKVKTEIQALLLSARLAAMQNKRL